MAAAAVLLVSFSGGAYCVCVEVCVAEVCAVALKKGWPISVVNQTGHMETGACCCNGWCCWKCVEAF